jgi:NAD(P)H dehydrogenase (quinone)
MTYDRFDCSQTESQKNMFYEAMTKRILIILGHPAHERRSFCEALAASYQEGAQESGHEVKLIKVAQLHFDPILHEGYQGNQSPEPDIAAAQEKVRWAEHLVIVYPMWVYMIPALLKGFFERTFTEGFAYGLKSRNPLKKGLLNGKSARIIQTMGMPTIMYRLMHRAHGAKALRSALQFCGIAPVRMTFCGMIEGGDRRRKAYLEKAKVLGRTGA